jgi:two-component system, chemotaxis family, CheB/CheR fusion protein
MKTNTTNNNEIKEINSEELVEKISDESWTYIKTVVDVVHEPVLILNSKLCVVAANEPFYRTFQVEEIDTENKLVYELGNGQWNIPALRKLLEDILPKNTFFKGFEVIHKFPFIGHKIMILNARRIHFTKNKLENDNSPQIILLAIEDVTEIMAVAETLTDHVKNLEVRLAKKTQGLEQSFLDLEKEIKNLKKN